MAISTMEQNLLLRLQVEDFLYYEASLLDDWKLNDWLALFTEDGQYIVPSTDHPKGNPDDSVCLIGDDIVRLQGRITRLKSRRAYREFPYSRTKRLISNVRILEDSIDEVKIEANFLIYRIRNGHDDPYVGRYEYTLSKTDDSFKIKVRRAEISFEALRPHGTVSIIL
jgi:p-cumate 2,3-dioxygenase beta subunit